MLLAVLHGHKGLSHPRPWICGFRGSFELQVSLVGFGGMRWLGFGGMHMIKDTAER